MKGYGLQILIAGMLVCCLLWVPAISSAAGEPVAIFPLQELGDGRNDANLPFTVSLAERLTESGSEIIGLDTVITFMANNRIRTVGYMETLNISKARRDLGATFVLLGTVSQRKEKPEPSLGLTMKLVRTSDLRTVWIYVGSLSTGEERKVLGIGEPRSSEELQPMLLDEIIARWPWEIINKEQQVGSLNIDTAVLKPKYVRPGEEIQSLVRLRDTWTAGQAPRVFFKVNDQIYPATVSADGITYEGSWVAGQENGRFSVILLLEWPLYGRTEEALLGNYFIDGTPPLFEIDLRGTKMLDDMPVFSNNLVIMPRMIVRKPISRWRLAFYYEGDTIVGEMKGTGNLPKTFTWQGKGSIGDGIYEVVIDAWDLAGNMASANKKVEMNRSLPQVDLVLEQGEEELLVDLQHESKVPLRYWRLEMWTKEGRILTQTEGRELPVRLGIKLPDSDQGQEIEGFLFYQDILGKEVRRKVQDLLPKSQEKVEAREEKPEGISEKWVDEF